MLTTIAERLAQAADSWAPCSGDRSAPCESPCKSLLNGDAWDAYRLESLLPLKETYRETTQFGFLLRHYWIPATVLTFRQSSRLTLPDGRMDRRELNIERTMARCRSNECLWREKIRPALATNASTASTGETALLSEMLCSYDCYEQTYATNKPILFKLRGPDEKTEARRQALYHLPFLCPPGPVPIGFAWYAKVGDDYMNYRLEAEERLGETSVLVVRREGRYTTWVSRESARGGNGSSNETSSEAPGGGTGAIRVVTERKGITLFAWNRGAVLEDRFEDRIVEADGCLASAAGAISQVVTRLIRSCPEKLAEPAMKKPENGESASCVECEPRFKELIAFDSAVRVYRFTTAFSRKEKSWVS